MVRTERTAQMPRCDDKAHDEQISWCSLQKTYQHYAPSNKSVMPSFKQISTTQHTQLLSQLTMREMKSISRNSETSSGAFA